MRGEQLPARAQAQVTLSPNANSMPSTKQKHTFSRTDWGPLGTAWHSTGESEGRTALDWGVIETLTQIRCTGTYIQLNPRPAGGGV